MDNVYFLHARSCPDPHDVCERKEGSHTMFCCFHYNLIMMEYNSERKSLPPTARARLRAWLHKRTAGDNVRQLTP